MCGRIAASAARRLLGAAAAEYLHALLFDFFGRNSVSTSPTSARLSVIDRFLPLWILGAMALGLLVGHLWPGVGATLDAVKIAGVSLPIAFGLFWMMYPVLAKVRYGKLGGVSAHGKLFVTSLAFNWLLGPLLMFLLAWLLLPDLPHYRTGLILIGLARCIAMVLIWNMLARGSNEVAALLVALNSVFQILFYSVLGWFYLTVVPSWLGAGASEIHVSMLTIARSVLLFLGLPLAAGAATRGLLVRSKGESWYERCFLPRIAPTALLGLLYTIVLMFAMQGDKIVRAPLDVVRIAIPLVLYFLIMFGSSFFIAKKLGFSYEETASLSFTAAGNNFELAIAVSVGLFGIASGEALAGVVGPLIEVPALLALVYLSLWLKRRWFASAPPRVPSSVALEGPS
jgi:ACR3 family arsenite transporter